MLLIRNPTVVHDWSKGTVPSTETLDQRLTSIKGLARSGGWRGVGVARRRPLLGPVRRRGAPRPPSLRAAVGIHEPAVCSQVCTLLEAARAAGERSVDVDDFGQRFVDLKSAEMVAAPLAQESL